MKKLVLLSLLFAGCYPTAWEDCDCRRVVDNVMIGSVLYSIDENVCNGYQTSTIVNQPVQIGLVFCPETNF